MGGEGSVSAEKGLARSGRGGGGDGDGSVRDKVFDGTVLDGP